MKYGLYLESKARPEWRSHYLDYNTLKDLIDEATKQEEAGDTTAFSQRVTSLTVARPAGTSQDSAHERFCTLLSQEVRRHSEVSSRSPPGALLSISSDPLLLNPSTTWHRRPRRRALSLRTVWRSAASLPGPEAVPCAETEA